MIGEPLVFKRKQKKNLLIVAFYVLGAGGKWDQRGPSDTHGSQRYFIEGI